MAIGLKHALTQEAKMKYRVHRFEISMTKDQHKLEQFLNNLEGDLIAIVPNVVSPFSFSLVNFLLIVEKVNSGTDL
jgi:hypothetical protein